MLMLAAGTQGGKTAGNGEFVGAKLDGGAANGPERMALNAAIDKLQAIATAETNAQNKATEQRVIDCLKKMLASGQLCKETGTSTDNATWQDGSCDWSADRMNIRANQLTAGEPTAATWERFVEIRTTAGTLMASARTVWVLVDATTARPKRIDAAMRGMFEG